MLEVVFAACIHFGGQEGSSVVHGTTLLPS
jgi:hypothetical protein